MSQFSQELLKLESENSVADIWRTNDCVVGLRLRLIALVNHFSSIFLSFYLLDRIENIDINIENLYHSF